MLILQMLGSGLQKGFKYYMCVDDQLTRKWIEWRTHDKNREFRKYWSDRLSPEDEMVDLTLVNPERVIVIIENLISKIEDEWLLTLLAAGIFETFHVITDKKHLGYFEKKAETDPKYKFILENAWI